MATVEERAHCLHAFLVQDRNDLSVRLAKSIAKEFGVPPSETNDKVPVLVTGYLIFLIDSFLRERESNMAVADRFLQVIGKSEEAMALIRGVFGHSSEEGKKMFRVELRDLLGVATEATLSEYYEMTVRISAETAVELSTRAVKHGNEISLERSADAATLATCTRCGTKTQLEQDDKFCHRCGARIPVTDWKAVEIRVESGRFHMRLACPACGVAGENYPGHMEFELLGKDAEGYLYVACPGCARHIQVDTLNSMARCSETR